MIIYNNNIEEIDEFELDCECNLDYDDEEDFDEENERPKKKSNKVPEKTIEDYLTVLKTLFDDVICEVLPYDIQSAVETSDQNRLGNHTYCRLLCRNNANISENKNPNIKHVNWVEFKIRNENDWPKKHINYIIDNHKKLVKDEGLNFFMKEDTSVKKGLNYYLFYKSRSANPIPLFEDMMELRKATLMHIFQDGLYEEENPRIDFFDEYDFEGYSFRRMTEGFKENGATDIELVDVFSMRLQLGNPHQSCTYNGEDCKSYPYWCDNNRVTDSGNNIDYYYEESIFNKDFIAWLREFTGWKTKSIDSLEDEIVTDLMEHLAYHHKLENSELMKLVKQFGDTKIFQKALNDKHSDSNGGGGGNQFMCLLGHSSTRTKAGLEISLTARKSHLEHYGFWNDAFTKHYGEQYFVFEGNAYQKVWEYYNPKGKHLDLFSMFEDDELIEPANNMIEKRKPMQLSLF